MSTALAQHNTEEVQREERKRSTKRVFYQVYVDDKVDDHPKATNILSGIALTHLIKSGVEALDIDLRDIKNQVVVVGKYNNSEVEVKLGAGFGRVWVQISSPDPGTVAKLATCASEIVDIYKDIIQEVIRRERQNKDSSEH